MERTKQKPKKDKPNKHVDKEKPSTFIADVKTFKENLKIREILRTVKMNSSTRIKAPRGSKVMDQKDFNENEDIFEDSISVEGQDEEEPPSATNTVLNIENDGNVVPKHDCVNNEGNISNTDVFETEFSEIDNIYFETSVIHKSKSLEGLEDCAEDDGSVPSSPAALTSPTENAGVRSRDRKLSFDHTMLLRREGLSQSEVDLHFMGKSPLVRKSSFFRRKMESFLKNTTEIFKRQSQTSKTTTSSLKQRKGSNCSRMSVSLQSLNENSAYGVDYEDESIDKYHDQQGSVTSLRSSATQARSNSGLSVNVSDRPPDQSEEESLAGSHQWLDSFCQVLDGSRHELDGSHQWQDGSRHSQLLPETSTINSSNGSYMQDSLLNTPRAISMSSGLDTANGQRRRKTSRSNRVSWLASESLTDYFRRLIQDEKCEEIKGCHSFQDFLSIPENNLVGPRTDSKGRRLSYVRAVSGEDPVLPSRNQDTTFRKKKLSDYEGTSLRSEIETFLAAFERNGIPELEGYTAWKICPEADALLELLDTEAAVEKYFDWKSGLPSEDEVRQEIIKELVYTEAQYIRHLQVIVKVYIASAHALQNCGVLLDLSTSILFRHIPDVLNSNIRFWERTLFPMLQAAKQNGTLFDTSLLIPGFNEFAEIFESYEEYVQSQTTAVEYLRLMNSSLEFMIYLTWCNQNTGNRLQLADILVKPMQRLTKYSLLIKRLSHHVETEEKKRELELVDAIIRSFTLSVNRAVRQKEEFTKVDELKVEPYEPDFKGDDDMERAYKKFSRANLLLPMIDCAPSTNRCLIHQGYLRYKDFQKEFDAHVLLFTDMILICKKYTKAYKDKEKKEVCHWKMLRPKILLHRAIPNIKPAKTSHDLPALIYVLLDEQGCSKAVFQLSETSKDPNPAQTIKVWESKLYEAMMTYTLTKWYHKYPVRDLSIIEKEYNDESYKREYPEACAVEKRSRDRVAATMHPNKRQHDPVKDIEILMSAIDREKGPPHLHSIFVSGMKNFNAWQSRSSSFHQSTTSRSSHMSSSELHVSVSGGSHEELPSVSLQRSGSSVEQYLPPNFFDDIHPSPSITVNVVAENDCATLIRSRLPSPPTLVLQQSSPHHSPGPRSASAGGSSENTLRVSPSHTIVHSLPDIRAELHHKPEPKAIVPQTASEKLYRSHQELMQRNRLAAGQHYLTPDHRGSSYPPPSPTRASLKRGLAFSYSFKSNPPLTRSKNVHSASQVQIEVPKFADVPRRILRRSPQHTEPQTSTSKSGPPQRSPSPSRVPGTYRADMNIPSASMDKPEKKKSLFLRRSKESTRSVSPERTRGDQSDDTDYDTDDDRSRRSSKSNKGEKGKLRVESCIIEDQDSIVEEEQAQSGAVEQEASGKPAGKNKVKG